MKLKADIIKSSYFAGEWQLSELLYPDTNTDFYREKLPEGFSPKKSQAFLHQKLKDYKKEFDRGKKDFARKIQETRKVNSVFVIWDALWTQIEKTVGLGNDGELIVFTEVAQVPDFLSRIKGLVGLKSTANQSKTYDVKSYDVDEEVGSGLHFAYSQKEILEARTLAHTQGIKTRYIQSSQFTDHPGEGVERAKLQNPVEVYFSGSVQVAVVVEGIAERNFFFELLESKMKIENLDLPYIIQEYLVV